MREKRRQRVLVWLCMLVMLAGKQSLLWAAVNTSHTNEQLIEVQFNIHEGHTSSESVDDAGGSSHCPKGTVGDHGCQLGHSCCVLTMAPIISSPPIHHVRVQGVFPSLFNIVMAIEIKPPR